ncbi:MAG TPA: hypothetical protein VI670_05345 [Thermoanaerobaculia bacterium]|jgi:hypothetical protein
MKRIAILLLLAAACRKAEAPATTSSAPPPAAETTTTAPAAAKYVPPPDVSVATAPVPTNGLSLWLRADSGVTAGADGKVSAWAVEGSPVKATATDPAQQPTLAQNAIGGKPAIHFDGGTQMLEANIDIDPAASPELTVISVFTSETDAATPLRKLYGADDGGYDRAAGLDDRAEGMNYTIFGGGAGVVGIMKLTANTPYLTVDSYDQPKKKLNVWVNGAPVKQNADIDHSAGLDKFYIGGTGTVYHEPWFGNVAEMLVYHRVLSDDERKKVEGYLGAKYGVKVTGDR